MLLPAADESYMREQHIAPDNDWNYVHNLMYSVANLLEAGQLQEAAKVSAKLGKARGHLEDTLYPWSPRDAIARLNPALPVALRTADWARWWNWSMPRIFPRTCRIWNSWPAAFRNLPWECSPWKHMNPM